MLIFDLDNSSEGEPRLLLNGSALENSSGSRAKSGLLFADLWGEAIQQTELLSVSDLSAQFLRVKVHLPDAKEDPRGWNFISVEIHPNENVHDRSVTITFRATIDYLRWAMPYGVADLEAALESVLDANPELGFEPAEDFQDEFGVSCRIPTNTTIREVIGMSSRLPALVRLIEDELSDREYPNLVIKRFEFPSSITAVCILSELNQQR